MSPNNALSCYFPQRGQPHGLDGNSAALVTLLGWLPHAQALHPLTQLRITWMTCAHACACLPKPPSACIHQS
eukprot:1159284-Pelagomonas_calceolata.AAC.3